MIKLLLALACCVAAAIVAQGAPATYTTKYDNVNIDEILNNDRLVANYFKCLMETGKCTPEGEEIKSEYYFHAYNWKRCILRIICYTPTSYYLFNPYDL